MRQAGEGTEDFANEDGELNQATGSRGELVSEVVGLSDTLGRKTDDAEAKGRPEGEEEDDRFGSEEGPRAGYSGV